LRNYTKKPDSEIIHDIWCSIPNITTKTAILFIDKGYHISDLFLGVIKHDDIFNLKYSNGAIIGKRSNKIINITKNHISNNIYYCKILTAIPGITKQTAQKILEGNTFVDLLKGNVSIDDIANIKKTEKSKIGKSAAEKIHKFLVKK